ncbi:cobalamin-dependent protein, partial [Candidatus Fermentibacterales bacterium]|nr:cobalamin-dependent protein [Candidatus Fermentibacterales bacterium]
MSRVLFVNPPSAIAVYDSSKIRVAITSAPFVTLASLAGAVLASGNEACIADLMVETRPFEALRQRLSEFRPDIVGVTFTTPLWSEARKIAGLVREALPSAMLVAGGVHACALTEEVLRSGYDVVVLGEGERTIVDLCSGAPLAGIPGLAWLE